MGSTKKLIELDDKAIEVLEKEAKKQKRSLKNYLEYTLEDMAIRSSEPSEEYKKMMDEMIEKVESGEMKTYSLSDVMKEYGR